MYILMRPGLRVSGLGGVGHRAGQDIQPAGAGVASRGPKLSEDEDEIKYVELCRHLSSLQSVAFAALARKSQLQLGTPAPKARRHVALADARSVRFTRFAGLCPPDAMETVGSSLGCR